MKILPSISVVIATYNRSETLARTLACIAEQTFDPTRIEVIISDDGSPDNTEATVNKSENELPLQIVYHRHENHGVGYTQNRGIELATAPIVLLIADDIWLQPNAIEEHLNKHHEYPDQEFAILGRVDQSPELNQSAFLRTWNPFQFNTLKDGKELPYYMFWACQISFKRDLLIQYGMFRENLGQATYAGHEDTELGYRLHKKGGLRIIYTASARGCHYHITTLETELKRSYGRGINWQLLKEYVPAPEVVVRFHVLMWKTLPDYLKAIKERKEFLMESDRSIGKLMAQHLSRYLLFNKLTVKYLWLPLFNLAEHYPVIESMMHYQFYRGVIYYHFLMGCHQDAK